MPELYQFLPWVQDKVGKARIGGFGVFMLPDTIAALRGNASLYVPATKTVMTLMEKRAG